MERERDRQMDRLTARLRDEGASPQRDLWPGIDAEITRRERAGRRRRSWWRPAVAVAAVLLVVVTGRSMLFTGPVGDGDPKIIAELASAPQESGMETVDKALDELEQALAADPENHSLSRLVLMVHRKRGELLR